MVIIVEEEGYFQITCFTEEDEGKESVATLKDWAGGSLDGETRTIKVRWAEDAEIIRDGLLKEDRELFCTVAKIFGKEVLGDFKLLPKDPRIMNMPDLVMDMIFSPLPFEDLLNCRLACPNWAFDRLQIQRIFACRSLCLDGSSVGYTAELRGLHEPLTTYNRQKYLPIKRNHLPAIAKASLLQNVGCLGIIGIGPNDGSFCFYLLTMVLENCLKTKTFNFVEDGLIYWIIWRSIEEFVSNNHQHLEELSLVGEVQANLVDLETFLPDCDVLHTLRMKLRHKNSLMNLGSLPSSITSLTLLKLKTPLSPTQLTLIATNLKKLIRGNLHVKHYYHSKDDEDEVKGSTVSDIIFTHPSLQALYLALGKCSGLLEFYYFPQCIKARSMKQYLKDQDQLLSKGKGMGWDIDIDNSLNMEYLVLVKDGYKTSGEFYDDWN